MLYIHEVGGLQCPAWSLGLWIECPVVRDSHLKGLGMLIGKIWIGPSASEPTGHPSVIKDFV